MYSFNINTAGFVIVGMFIVTWAAAMLIWKYGHVEEKWNARQRDVNTSSPHLEAEALGIETPTGG
jgi:hypothetical protein